jgi:hypothetical protein
MAKVDRDQPVSTAAGNVAVMRDVLVGPPQVPDHIKLRDCDRPYWDAVLRARALDEWGKVELALAAQLARVMADIDAEQERMAEESAVLQSKGWPCVNPRLTAITNLTGRQIKLMSALRITGMVVADNENPLPARKAEREAERAVRLARKSDTVDEAPLLAL